MSEDSGRLVGGRYRLGDVLGRGGMGTVWRGEDEILGRRVAVKELRFPSSVDDEEKQRLITRTLREAKAIARIRSRSAITVYDVVDEDDRPWIVMELVEGVSLADHIRKEGPLTPRRAAEVGLAILDVLRAAHREGILHRDVKPSNVLLEDGSGRVVLTDFGIAKVEGDPSVTSTGMLVGAPSYISPERARGKPPGPPADLWSLGGLLYAAVEGHPPYDSGSAIGTLTAVMTEPVPEPEQAGPLTEAIYGLLMKDPEKRLDVEGARALLEPVAAGTARGADGRASRGAGAKGAGAGAGAVAGARDSLTKSEAGGAGDGAAVPGTDEEHGPTTYGRRRRSSSGTSSGERLRSAWKSVRNAATASVTGAAGAAGTSGAVGTAGTAGGDGAAGAAGTAGAAVGSASAGATATPVTPEKDESAGVAEPAGDVAEDVAQDGLVAKSAPVAGSPETKTEKGSGEKAAAGSSAVAASSVQAGGSGSGGSGGSGAGGSQGGGGVGIAASLASLSTLKDRYSRRTLGIAAAAVVAVLVVLAVLVVSALGGTHGAGPKQTAGKGTAASTGKGQGQDKGQDDKHKGDGKAPGDGKQDDGKDKGKGKQGGGADSPSPSTSSSPAGSGAGKQKGGPAVPKGYAKVTDHRFHFAMAMPKGFKRTGVAGQGSGGKYDGGGLPRIQVDFSSHPLKDAAAGWRAEEPIVKRTSSGYHKIAIKKVSWRGYPTVADWEFERNDDGKRVHVLNRGFRMDSSHGYSILITCAADKWDGKECRKLRNTAFSTFTSVG